MPIASNDWWEQMKDYVHQAVGQSLSVIEGTVSSRQASPPSVKVILQPYGVETGWLRIGVLYAGNGFGFVAVPPEGQAVKVIFDMGDKSSGTVVCDVYNDIDVPPPLSTVDDVCFVHKSGSKLYFHDSGEIDVQAAGTLALNGGSAGVARIGDTVQVNVAGTNYTGTIQSGSSSVKA